MSHSHRLAGANFAVDNLLERGGDEMVPTTLIVRARRVQAKQALGRPAGS